MAALQERRDLAHRVVRDVGSGLARQLHDEGPQPGAVIFVLGVELFDLARKGVADLAQHRTNKSSRSRHTIVRPNSLLLGSTTTAVSPWTVFTAVSSAVERSVATGLVLPLFLRVGLGRGL